MQIPNITRQHFVVVPDNIRNRAREWLNHSYTQWTIYVVFAGVIATLISVSGSFDGWIKAIFIGLGIGTAIIFQKFFRNETTVLKTRLMYDFLMRKKDGNTIVAKYREHDIEKIKKSIMIEQVYERGLIRFKYNQYGVMYNYSPPNIGGDGLWEYILSTVQVIHSLMHPMLIKFYVMNRVSDPLNYKKDLVKSLNSEKSTAEQKEHILSLVKLIEDKKDRSPDWVFRCITCVIG